MMARNAIDKSRNVVIKAFCVVTFMTQLRKIFLLPPARGPHVRCYDTKMAYGDTPSACQWNIMSLRHLA